jgi:hypothetical protein
MIVCYESWKMSDDLPLIQHLSLPVDCFANMRHAYDIGDDCCSDTVIINSCRIFCVWQKKVVG